MKFSGGSCPFPGRPFTFFRGLNLCVITGQAPALIRVDQASAAAAKTSGVRDPKYH